MTLLIRSGYIQTRLHLLTEALAAAVSNPRHPLRSEIAPQLEDIPLPPRLLWIHQYVVTSDEPELPSENRLLSSFDMTEIFASTPVVNMSEQIAQANKLYRDRMIYGALLAIERIEELIERRAEDLARSFIRIGSLSVNSDLILSGGLIPKDSWPVILRLFAGFEQRKFRFFLYEKDANVLWGYPEPVDEFEIDEEYL